jgi:hypothetical protein
VSPTLSEAISKGSATVVALLTICVAVWALQSQGVEVAFGLGLVLGGIAFVATWKTLERKLTATPSDPNAERRAAPGRSPGLGPADLDEARAAFAAHRSMPSAATLDRCFEAMRRNYVVDIEMAKQPDHFLCYGDLILDELRADPSLKSTKLGPSLTFLATDLQDTGVTELAAKGKEIQAMMGESERDLMRRELD